MMVLMMSTVALLSFTTASLHSSHAMVAGGRACRHVSMAGFGSAAPKKAKSKAGKASKKGLDPMKQWSIYSELRKLDDVTTTSVYARLPGEGEKWKEVGGCVVQLPGTRQQGVMLHKRLILEHAARLSPSHALRSRELLCGYTDLPGSMQSTEADIVTLEKCDVPPELRAGFCGLPDTKTNMYATKTTAPKETGKGVKGANRDSKGRL